MVRSPRLDAPGRFHHVFNRAARRQVLFADSRDYRHFLMLLACAVRRGELVVHAHCLMSTHFHLLVASPDGRLSYAMMRIQNAYVRYRNRRSRLDGPLVRGRFGSRPVLSLCYWRTLLRYIAYNAVQAGLCEHPLEYPYSSARYFLGGGAPPWFDRAAVEGRLGHLGTSTTMTQRYAAFLRMPLTDGEARLVEQRMKHPRLAEDELYSAPPAYLAKWMARKIEAGRGESPWIPVAAPQAVLQALTEAEARLGAYAVRAGRKHHDGWSILAAGLLYALACLTTNASGKELGFHGTTVSRRIKLHWTLMLEDREYARRAGAAARRALDLTFPG
jgi:putative transposase